jgi:hypothetical protein
VNNIWKIEVTYAVPGDSGQFFATGLKQGIEIPQARRMYKVFFGGGAAVVTLQAERRQLRPGVVVRGANTHVNLLMREASIGLVVMIQGSLIHMLVSLCVDAGHLDVVFLIHVSNWTRPGASWRAQ